ncbi:hypothetical protein Trco_007060 [Trichoderma cornu-damae]|uniref:Uncharacterized protein n=1 Tax=Trichoderma cornu-damae TaxID=654480 RepID=A0A9P8QMH1_9HYPO|nr:hypothetical protein Trco_007060 [Trichoderma cornu-damae]
MSLYVLSVSRVSLYALSVSRVSLPRTANIPLSNHARSVSLRGDNEVTRAAKTYGLIFAAAFIAFSLCLLALSLWKNRRPIAVSLRRGWRKLPFLGLGIWRRNREESADPKPIFLRPLPSSSQLRPPVAPLDRRNNGTGSAETPVEGVFVLGPFPTPGPFVEPQFFCDGEYFAEFG